MGLTPPGSNSQSKSYALPEGAYTASLDSSTSHIYTPYGVAGQICADLGGKNDSIRCAVDCGLRKRSGGLTFAFSWLNITVPYQDLITPQTTGDQTNCSLVVEDGRYATNPPSYVLGGEL